MLGKKCLITGGTGSLGTAILERAEKEGWGVKFTVIARNETKINQTKHRFPNVDCKVGDIQDTDFLRAILPGHDTIVHAAAQKVVPLAESNVRNSVMTNVMGTLAICQTAVESRVGQVITVLTDKLVSSTTVYGSTKFLAGAIAREANSWGNTRFSNVRYGNVVGSANSILPHLLRQKEDNKPFTITDARCTRFWLSMDEAIDLVLLASRLDNPGTTVVPKAPASKVIDLFRAVDPNWEIVDIGIRPGEKIHEQLIDEVESRCTIDAGEYFVVYPPDRNITSNLPDGYGYYSDTTARQLSITELQKLLGMK